MTDMTTRFRVHNYIIDTWMEEGTIPTCAWHNGRRFWNSDDINQLIKGDMIRLPITKTLKAEKKDLDLFPIAILTCLAIVLINSF